ncbi:hypothetical protein [Empedobacter tilapiae]
MPDLSPNNAKNSAFNYWRAKAEKISKEVNYYISISTLLEEISYEYQKENQFDLGDFIIENKLSERS